MRSKHYKFTILIALLALLVTALPAGAQDGSQGTGFGLTILHTNDVHARVDQFDSGGNTCDEEELAANECFGGAARVKTAADQVRAEAANSVLLDAGDQFQGTLFYNQYRGGEAQEMMALLGYQAMAIGNHEFDNGPGTLGSFLRSVKFPVVSANIDASAEPELAGLIKPYTILEVGGEKIGVVGATTIETDILSSPGPNVKFNDVAASVEAAVAELTQAGVNKIIALTHLGYPADQELAKAVAGLDVIVGGHSHTLLSNSDAAAAGPYPTVVAGPDGNQVLVVTNGAWARSLGRLDVTFDDAGVVTAFAGEPILLDSSIAQDEAVQNRVDALAAPLEALQAEVIGSATVNLDGDRSTCRFGECTMGNLITDAMLWKTQGEGVELAITNGGGIRASIEAGDVTVGDVLTVLPFGNMIATFELNGAEVVQALENGVSRAENPENEGTGRFPQVAGLRYSWNPNLPVGSRITSVEVKNADGTFSPIDPAATYKVASNDFMRTGGDGYEVFVSARNAYDFGPSLDQAVQEYIKTFSPVAPEVEGRVTQSDAPAAAPQTGVEPAAPSNAACTQDYVVQADDWLSKLAERFLGDVTAYDQIFSATNTAAAADTKYATLADPNIIEVGQVLCIPGAAPAAP
ncbi:MAG: LysM peptidoglycan-binding domain-containing protein [Anaerolineales bacterium]|nr:LysM peptidoglycan-binding domain-containing protein [Anaerolineales bacterium]